MELTGWQPTTSLTGMTNELNELETLLAEYGFKPASAISGTLYRCGASWVKLKEAMPKIEFGATHRVVFYPMHDHGDLSERLQAFAASRSAFAYVRTFTNRP